MNVLRPQLVNDAVTLAESLHFTKSCLDEVGALLHVLAGTIPFGKIADIGTGCGVSTAWMASATSLNVFTIDSDTALANGIRTLFADYPQVHPMVGDWEDILQDGPFRLVFVDAKPAKLAGVDRVVQATEVGGLLVLDDLSPIEFWPAEWKGRPDPVRDAWLNHPQLTSIEIRTSQKVAAIVARRIA